MSAQAFNLASNGATTDSDLVPPSVPNALSVFDLLSKTVFMLWLRRLHRSLVDQVTQFKSILAQKPAGVEWNSTNALFIVWTGINDVVCHVVFQSYGEVSELSSNPRSATHLVGYANR